MNSESVTTLVIAAAAMTLPQHAHTEPASLALRCTDSQIEYRLTQILRQDLQRRGHTAVADNTATLQLRAVCASVSQAATASSAPASGAAAPAVPLGFALAVTIARKAQAGGWDTIHFSNHFFPLQGYDEAVRRAIREVAF
jgi:hypothetical protein